MLGIHPSLKFEKCLQQTVERGSLHRVIDHLGAFHHAGAPEAGLHVHVAVFQISVVPLPLPFVVGRVAFVPQIPFHLLDVSHERAVRPDSVAFQMIPDRGSLRVLQVHLDHVIPQILGAGFRHVAVELREHESVLSSVPDILRHQVERDGVAHASQFTVEVVVFFDLSDHSRVPVVAGGNPHLLTRIVELDDAPTFAGDDPSPNQLADPRNADRNVLKIDLRTTAPESDYRVQFVETVNVSVHFLAEERFHVRA